MRLSKTGEEIYPNENAVWAYSHETHLENVKNNLALATVYNNQDAQAAKALEVAVEMLNGNAVDEDIIVETILFTKDNLPK